MTRTPRIAAVAVTVLTLTLNGCTAAPSPETQQVLIGTDLILTVEQVRTVEEQRTGLAGRDSIPDGTGMLFTFDPAGPRRVWMAGMRFPIDIAWILDGRIIATDTLPVCTLPNVDDCPRWDSPGNVDALLETTAGALDDIASDTLITLTEAGE